MPDRKDLLARKLSSLSTERRSRLQALSAAKIDGHTSIARCLKELGIEQIYSISGLPIDGTLVACARVGMTVIGVRHQQNGVLMALAQNYVAGKLVAAVILSSGPAITNATTGLLVARDNAWPLLVLGGRRTLHVQWQGQFQDLDAVALFQPITKHASLVAATADIPAALRQAAALATSDRPGPVYLDIPQESLSGTAIAASDGEIAACHLQANVTTSFNTCDRDREAETERAIAAAARLLLRAQRPALVIGKGLRWASPASTFSSLATFVDRYRIPFVTSPMGRGYLPEDSPLCFTSVRTALLSDADVVLVLAARLNWTFRFGTEFAPTANLIRVDIEPAELTVNVTPTVGIARDAGDVLDRLLAHMQRSPSPERPAAFDAWLARLDRLKADKERAIAPLLTSAERPMTPQRLVAEVQTCLPKDAICTVEGNVILTATEQVLRTHRPASILTPGSNGCIGVGIPFAIGAKVAQPDRLVVAICGDTGFGMSAMELETAVRYGIPIVVVVANNDGNCGSLKSASYPPEAADRVTMFQPDLRYDQIAIALGARGEYITDPEALPAALQRAISANTVTCLNVKVAPDAPYPKR